MSLSLGFFHISGFLSLKGKDSTLFFLIISEFLSSKDKDLTLFHPYCPVTFKLFFVLIANFPAQKCHDIGWCSRCITSYKYAIWWSHAAYYDYIFFPSQVFAFQAVDNCLFCLHNRLCTHHQLILEILPQLCKFPLGMFRCFGHSVTCVLLNISVLSSELLWSGQVVFPTDASLSPWDLFLLPSWGFFLDLMFSVSSDLSDYFFILVQLIC